MKKAGVRLNNHNPTYLAGRTRVFRIRGSEREEGKENDMEEEGT